MKCQQVLLKLNSVPRTRITTIIQTTKNKVKQEEEKLDGRVQKRPQKALQVQLSLFQLFVFFSFGFSMTRMNLHRQMQLTGVDNILCYLTTSETGLVETVKQTVRQTGSSCLRNFS